MMPEVSFGGLLVVAAIAVGAPLLVGLAPAIRVPAVVLEIVAGIVVGPSLLGWVEPDLPIEILGLVGLAFLLFLAGLEIDLERLRGRPLKLAGGGYLLTLAIGLPVGLAFTGAGLATNPLLVALMLSATSLGLIVPILKDSGQVDRDLGQLTLASASVADFAAVLLLSFLFSQTDASPAGKLILLALFAAVIVLVALTILRLERWMRLGAVLTRLEDTTAEIRVRLAVVLLVGFTALAGRVGLETILGAFLAGAILSLTDRDAMAHPQFRAKLEAIGYGFLIPVFFVSSGLRFDLEALLETPAALARLPLFLAALLLVRGVPALLYRPVLGRRGATVAALLQATSLPFIVTAAEIGVSVGAIEPVTGAGLVAAGLLSVVVFPLVATGLLRRQDAEQASSAGGPPAVRAADRGPAGRGSCPPGA